MADRYWVGGTGTWNGTNTANWSDTSGGAGGASVPTSADNVIFNNNSNVGTGSFTVTISTAAANCLNFSVISLDGAMTLTQSIGLNVYGSFTIPSTNFTLTPNGIGITFRSTASTSITTNGVTLDCPIVFSGVGGTWQLQDALTIGSTRNLTLTNGTLNLFGNSLTVGTFSSFGTTARSLISSIGSGTVFCTASTSTTVWSTGSASTQDITTNNSVSVNITGNHSGVTKTITVGEAATTKATSFDFTIGGNGTTFIFGGGNSFIRNLTITDSTCTIANNYIRIFGSLNIQGSSPTLSGGTLGWDFASTSGIENITTSGKTFDFPISFIGVGGTWRLQDALTVGSTRTVTLTAGTLNLNNFTLTTGIFTGSGSSTRALAFGTSGLLIATSSGTPITFTTSTSLTITGTPRFQLTNSSSTGIDIGTFWDPSSAISALVGAPTAAKGVYISGSPSGTIALSGRFLDIDLTGMTSGALSAGVRTIYGSLTVPSTMSTISGTNATTFSPTGSTGRTISTNGVVIQFPLVFNSGDNVTWQLQNALTLLNTRSITLTAGILDLNGYTLTCGSFSSTGTLSRRIASTSATNIVLTAATTSTVWNTSTFTNLTTSGNITAVINGNDAVTKTINSGALSEANSLHFTLGGNGTTFVFSGAVAVDNLTITNSTCTISNAALTIYGNLDIQGASPTFGAGTSAWTFAGTGARTIKTSGETLNTIIFNGVGGSWTLQDDLTIGSSRSVTLTNGVLNLNNFTLTAGFFNSNNSNTRSIQFGSGNIILIGAGGTVWDSTTATNLTVTGTPVVNISYTGALATNIYTGAHSEANSISFNFTGGTYNLDLSTSSVRDINFTGFSGSLQGWAPCIIYGSLTFDPIMTVSSTGSSLTFGATSGTKTITTGGQMLTHLLIFNGVGGTWQLQDNLSLDGEGGVVQANGTLDLNGKTLSIATASYETDDGVKNLTFNGGTLSLGAISPTTAFNNQFPTGFTTTAGTGIGKISMSGTSNSQIFEGGGSIYDCTLYMNSAQELIVNGSNTFNDISSQSSSYATISFTDGTTTTVQNFTARDPTPNLGLLNLRTITPGSRATLYKASGIVDVSSCDIKDIQATGGAIWKALLSNGNIDSGNNLGWIFVEGGTTSQNILLMFL